MSDTDFISQLPDSLLIHIMSFIPTRDAVHTCLVAKRWRNLWAFVPVLDLSDFCYDCSSSCTGPSADVNCGPSTRGCLFANQQKVLNEHLLLNDTNPNLYLMDYCGMSNLSSSLLELRHCCKFERFVQSVLCLRQTSQLDTLRLAWEKHSCHFPSHPDLNFIPDVLKLGPRALHFSMNLMNCCTKSLDLLFTCVSLEKMVLRLSVRIEGNKGFNVMQPFQGFVVKNLLYGPESIFLPHLKILHLSSYEVDTSFRDKLLTGCPLLEDLTLQSCSQCISEISSNTLKHLVLYSHSQKKETQILLFKTRSINFHFLKSLALHQLPINPNFMNNLLSGSPLLEELKLISCRLFISEISSSTLKYLTFYSCHSKKATQISTPNLLCLDMNIDGCAGGISFKSMPSLIKAHINFSCLGCKGHTIGGCSILSFLSNVTSLIIGLYGFETKAMLDYALRNCPTFNNLKSLMLKGCLIHCLNSIVSFIQHVPRLDKLCLDQSEGKFPDHDVELEPTSVSNETPVQCGQIQLVEIIHKRDEKNQKNINKLVNALHAHVKKIDKINILER